MTLTNPVQPRALSDAGLGRMRRALFRSSRYSGKSQNFGVRSSWVSLSKRILESWPRILRMSHAIVSERYSAKIQVRCVAVCRTLPLCASGYRLVARIWKQYPSKSRSICLLRPSSGIVRRANGQVLGKCTISSSFSYPSNKRTPAASSALPFIRTLPALPGSMDKRIMEQAYGTGECPAPSLPEGVTMHDLIQLKSTIPLRGSRTSFQLQLPKQAAVPFALPHMMMAMNPYMNILAAGMQAMGNQGQMQAMGNEGQNPAAERLSKALQDSPFEAVSASSSSMSARPQPALPAPTLVADVEDEASKERQKRASVPLLAIENTPMEKKQKKEDSTEIEKKNETEKIQETDQKVEATKEKAEEKPVETKAAEEKPAMAVNAELERALEVRDKSKNEKNGGNAPTTGEKPFKKPAAIMERPSASGSNLKRPAASGTTTSKGPIPSEKERKKMKPDGCSKCRHVVGCTASCWVQRGYHRRHFDLLLKWKSSHLLGQSSFCFYKRLHEPLLDRLFWESLVLRI